MQIATNLPTHLRAAGMEDKRYTLHSFQEGGATNHDEDDMNLDVRMEYEGWKSAVVARSYVGVTAYAAEAGVKRSRTNGTHRGWRPTAVRTVCTFTHSVPTGKLTPSPLEAKVD